MKLSTIRSLGDLCAASSTNQITECPEGRGKILSAYFAIIPTLMFATLCFFIHPLFAGLVALATLPGGGLVVNCFRPRTNNLPRLFVTPPEEILALEFFRNGFSRVAIVAKQKKTWHLLYLQAGSFNTLCNEHSLIHAYCNTNNIPFRVENNSGKFSGILSSGTEKKSSSIDKSHRE